MKKISFTTLLLIAVCFFASSTPVDSTTAVSVAKNFYVNNYLQQKDEVIDEFHVISVTSKSLNDLPSIYFIHFKTGGFVIVSGDDAAFPIIGYSLDGFSDDKSPSFDGWIEMRNNEIDYIRKNSIKSSLEIADEWNRLKGTNSNTKFDGKNVSPLITTKWGQGCYYNALCPSSSGSCPCNRHLTGCVATAMAQIMKFHNYPSKGVGSYSYYHNLHGYISADFENTTYNWSSMPNSVTTTNNAVATLMFHCGVSVEMDYADCSSGSGAYPSFVPTALVEFFNYSASTTLVGKEDFDSYDWNSLLRDELDNNRPMFYFGYGSGGHAFVCDGYCGTDFFHFNWGWNGSYDGYFYLNDLAPGYYSFTNNQGAVIGIAPSDDENGSGCIAYSQFGSGVAPVDNEDKLIEDMIYAGEYCVVTNIEEGRSYRFRSSVTSDFITISSTSNSIVSKGSSPVEWTATFSGSIRVHIHTNSSCGVQNSPRSVFVACTNCSSNGCIASDEWGSGEAPINNEEVEIEDGIYGGEFCTVNGIIEGQTYRFRSSINSDYLTLTTSTNSVLTYGNSPLEWTATFSGVIRVHVHTNSLCGTQTSARSIYVMCTSCSGSGCIAQNQYGSGEAPSNDEEILIEGQIYAGEFCVINNLVEGNIYIIRSSNPTDYLTITNNSNNVLDHGYSPLIWIASLSGSIRVHVHTNESCGVQSVIRSIFVLCTSCAPSCETPGIPTNLNGVSNGQTSATLSWSAGDPQGSNTVTYFWELYSSGALVTSGNTQNCSTDITGLYQGTSYNFRVAAQTNCNDTYSQWSGLSESFTTESSCETPGIPVALNGVATGQNSANLSWSQGSPTGSPNITYFWEIQNLNGSTVFTGSTSENSTNANGLSAGTTYNFRVRAHTSCNGTWSAWSENSSNFSTQPNCVTPGIPTDLIGVNLDNNSAALLWKQGTPEGSPSINYFWEAYSSEGTTIASGNTSNTSALAYGLSSGLSYNFRVRAYTTCNQTMSPWSANSANIKQIINVDPWVRQNDMFKIEVSTDIPFTLLIDYPGGFTKSIEVVAPFTGNLFAEANCELGQISYRKKVGNEIYTVDGIFSEVIEKRVDNAYFFYDNSVNSSDALIFPVKYISGCTSVVLDIDRTDITSMALPPANPKFKGLLSQDIGFGKYITYTQTSPSPSTIESPFYNNLQKLQPGEFTYKLKYKNGWNTIYEETGRFQVIKYAKYRQHPNSNDIVVFVGGWGNEVDKNFYELRDLSNSVPDQWAWESEQHSVLQWLSSHFNTWYIGTANCDGISHNGYALGKAMEKIAEKNPGKNLHIVGHSKGGLDIRAMLSDSLCKDFNGNSWRFDNSILNGRLKTTTFITAPLNGANLYSIASDSPFYWFVQFLNQIPASADMNPGSTVLNSLLNQTLPAEVSYMNIVTYLLNSDVYSSHQFPNNIFKYGDGVCTIDDQTAEGFSYRRGAGKLYQSYFRNDHLTPTRVSKLKVDQECPAPNFLEAIKDFIASGIGTNCYPPVATDSQTIGEVAVNVFPNPTHGELHIQIHEPSNVLFYSPLGALVYSNKLMNSSTINIDYLPNGIYILVIDGESNYFTTKVIKL